MRSASEEPWLPTTPATRLTRTFVRFLHIQAAGGVVLLAATIVALMAANVAWADGYEAFWQRRFEIRLGDAALDYPLRYWINDGLMAIFFFVIGLEIKRELVWGELRDRRNVVLPATAAIGGAAVPIGLYLLLHGQPPERGAWAVPMATDIAFVVGAMALLGSRVPAGLKIFVLSLAIIDDMLAVAVIAVFFTSSLKLGWLAAAVVGLACIHGFNRAGVRRVAVYVSCGAVVWLCTLKSGVHPTVAGALLGLMTPANAWIGDAALLEVAQRALAEMRGTAAAKPDPVRREAAMSLSIAATESVSPLERLEHGLHPWVGFVVMPLFALANAGVPMRADGVTHPVALAIAAALVLGKPLGIVSVAWLVVRAGGAKLPAGTSWTALVGAGCLSGVGFTMALFIASLSLSEGLLDVAKSGILIGSAASLVLGLCLLLLASGRKRR